MIAFLILKQIKKPPTRHTVLAETHCGDFPVLTPAATNHALTVCMQTFRAMTLDPGQLQMFEDSGMNLQSSQNTSSCFGFFSPMYFRLLPVLPLQSHRVFSAARVLCAETSPLPCVYSERLLHDFQSSPVPTKREEHPITCPVLAAQSKPWGEDKAAAETLPSVCWG